MIGQKVKVTIDRPLGSYHPNHKDIYYSVNYGYIEGIMAKDNEYQDAYVLGVNKPLKEFEGIVIAVIHRLNDIEDKLVVCPIGVNFTKEEIMKQVEFQEKYFESKISMASYEKSCGAVVFTKTENNIKYLIIQNKEGIYGFPKGHLEYNESEEETALREVYEEVGIKVNLIDGFKTIDEHFIPNKKDTIKRIVYFIGEYSNQEINYHKEEVLSASLMDYDKAISLFQYESSKNILNSVHNYITSLIKENDNV